MRLKLKHRNNNKSNRFPINYHKKGRTLIVILIPLLLMGFVAISLQLFKIKNISCESQFQTCSKQVVNDLNMAKGKSFIRAMRFTNLKLKENYLLQSYFVKFIPFDTLHIKVIEKVPRYIVKKDAADEGVLISQDGYVLGLSHSSALPEILIDSANFKLGDKINEESLFAVNLLSEITKFSKVAAASIVGSQFIVELDGGTKLLFPLEGDELLLRAKVYYVLTKTSVILDNAKEKGFAKINEIDFRFQNPVVRYK